MNTYSTEITVCVCEGLCYADKSLVMRPEHYGLIYEFSGSDTGPYLNVLTAGLAIDIDRAILIPDSGMRVPRDQYFQRERILVGDASLRNLCLEMLNYALGLGLDFSVVIESCTMSEGRSGLSYTQTAV